jgi:hypothetical protein
MIFILSIKNIKLIGRKKAIGITILGYQNYHPIHPNQPKTNEPKTNEPKTLETNNSDNKIFVNQPSLTTPENIVGEEVFLYGVERIIVVDEPLKVDLLVKNNTHINKKALIISSQGYPDYLKPRLQTILIKQPQILVGFIHQLALSIDEQLEQFEQNYQVKLQPGQIWDISANPKYPKKVNPGKTEPSKKQENPQSHSQMISVNGSPSQEETSYSSWIIPASIATGLGIAAIPESMNGFNDQNHPEDDDNEGHFEGIDTSDDSGFGGIDTGDDGGFGGVDTSDDSSNDSDGDGGDDGDGDGE